jgi:hypothetical protein
MRLRTTTKCRSRLLSFTLGSLLFACEKSDSDADQMEPGVVDEVCAALAESLCQIACTCDCELTWPGEPEVFADVSECQTVLVEACDLTNEAETPGFSACLSDFVDSVQDFQPCEMTYQLPDSCAPFFED